MSAPMSVHPDTKVSNSCNNWFCCTKKKSVSTEVQKTAQKALEVAEKYRRGSHQTDYTIDYDTVHVRVQSHAHDPASPEGTL